jgi:site-specific recombinase XerD
MKEKKTASGHLADNLAPDRIRELLEDFSRYLADRDKKPNTVEKYLRDARKFLSFCQGRDLDHSQVVRYREYLAASYAPSSVNSMLAALNGFLVFLGREDCCVRVLRVQRELFRDASRDMTVEEYIRLVKQADAEGNVRLSHMLQTMAGSGVRVGELSSITVESLDQKTVSISSKGKFRQILLPRTLVEKLRKYCRRMGVASGSIFVTSSGRPVDRRNIWKEMKNLCRRAGVAEGKVFPHNLRHLFARCFYEKEKDIVRLADYLGHSSVETTRRYTVTSEMEACRMSLEMGLLVDTEPENGHGGYGGSYGNRAGYRHKKRKVPATA